SSVPAASWPRHRNRRPPSSSPPQEQRSCCDGGVARAGGGRGGERQAGKRSRLWRTLPAAGRLDAMPTPDSRRLLHGPYRAPALAKGDRATCLLRDQEVVVTIFTDAPIPWPRCQPVGQRGGSGLLLDEELARAVRCESAAAIMHHWGVTSGVVWRWRRAL